MWEEELRTEVHARKAAQLDPELIFKIATSSLIYHFIKPMVKEIGKKLAKDFGDKIYEVSKENLKKFQSYVQKTISLTRNKTVPRNKPLVSIFEIPGSPYVELFAKNDDAALIANALSEKKFEIIRSEIDRFSKFVTIDEIHFSLTAKGKWKFTYLISTRGEIIGTQSSFKERDKIHERILLSPTAGYSIAGGGLQFEKSNSKNTEADK